MRKEARTEPRRLARGVAVGAAGLPGHRRRAGPAAAAAGCPRCCSRSAASARRRPASRSVQGAPAELRAGGAARAHRARQRARPRGGAGEPLARHRAQGAARLWAVRLLVAALLLAPVLVDRRRVRARAPPPSPGARRGCGGSCATAVPLVMALAFGWFLGVTGLLPATPPEPVAAGRDPGRRRRDRRARRDGAGGRAGLDRAAPGAAARCRRHAGARTGAARAIALLVMWCALAGVLWLTNPYAAALLVPGAHCAAGGCRPRGAAAPRAGCRARRAGGGAVRARRRLHRRPARPVAGRLRVVLRAARGRWHRRPASAGSCGAWCSCAWSPRSVVALRARTSATARAARGHRPRPDQLRRPGLAGRHGVRAAAMRRALRHRAPRLSALLGCWPTRGVTLAWQEPVSALRASRAQHRLARQLRALELATPRHAGRRRRTYGASSGAVPGAARGATARRSRELRIAAHRPAHVVVRGTDPADLRDGPRPHRPARRCRASAGRPRSPGTARPTAPRSAASTRCAAATPIDAAPALRHVPLRRRGHADRRARRLSVLRASAMIGSCSAPVIRSFPPLVASSCCAPRERRTVGQPRRPECRAVSDTGSRYPTAWTAC